MTVQKEYDCDTSPYWCSDEDYENRDKSFGTFIDDGRGYRIDDPNTPRPWLNYLTNRKFGSVISNRGLGFSWYRSTLLRVTKYEHPIDYLPRDFVDGREIEVEDRETGERVNLLREAENIVCTHRPGFTVIEASVLGVDFELTWFVPREDACEICLCRFRSDTTRKLTLRFSQIWSFAKFGIHTAEDGIPYISTPGNGLTTANDSKTITCEVSDADLPYSTMYGIFQSPDASSAKIAPMPEKRSDGRIFTFHECELLINVESETECGETITVISGAEITKGDFDVLKTKYLSPTAAGQELVSLNKMWSTRFDRISCEIPDKDVRNFLNVWLKNQLHLIFNFVRSGQNGYRDSLQDVWGMTLVDPIVSKERFLEILAHQCADGTAPRQFSAFADGIHDMRRFMDSPVWMSRTLIDLIKEIGDFSILDEDVRFLEGDGEASVDEHVFRALDYLYSHRGAHGICLTGDGDWNDALEGISKDGDAESVWLTIALYDSMRLMEELYSAAGREIRAEMMRGRADELKKIVNDVAWDGEWYVYGFTGTGKPIGSKSNKEGRIHLNAQSWAVFSGLATPERAKIAMASVAKHLETPLGPALMAPPYVNEGAEVGRIANLEPGTFENASIYQHAVTFHIFANLAKSSASPEKAFATFANLLPTNPENFDCRRTSEPYCTGNYYCGPGHARFGQNFFTWFTGNASWLIRAGFDEMLGVKADFNGLRIAPEIPDSWDGYKVTRLFRGCVYDIRFTHDSTDGLLEILVDGKAVNDDLVPVSTNNRCDVRVQY